jgi:3-hydroxyacyl-[acyl-carrier-protein] dehydratase
MNGSAAFTPHGPGFRFVDSFEQGDQSKSGTAQFHLKPDLWFFADHFPGNPIMPAVLLLECAAQAAGVLWMSLSNTPETLPGTPLFVAGVDTVRIQGPARPEDTLITKIELLKEFGSLAQFQFETTTSENTVACGRLTLSRQLKA